MLREIKNLLDFEESIVTCYFPHKKANQDLTEN